MSRSTDDGKYRKLENPTARFNGNEKKNRLSPSITRTGCAITSFGCVMVVVDFGFHRTRWWCGLYGCYVANRNRALVKCDVLIITAYIYFVNISHAQRQTLTMGVSEELDEYFRKVLPRV